ncbi:AAA family ATPase [Leptothoe sp. PORK10 BA2]|uniref:AAA family ATPase n=1 Tax=Leptothoe sp. PORK10 BA2 TaxID=3110254 RepID=UPI002B1F1E0D|nr:AAA family ATPase [Leptothoe sp. PORK10 BA2]MEA5466391.1 AAA family ATPase [Leptothoe sp. PORK10 BA2]
MRIERLKITNFKALRNVEMQDIPPFCIVIGANGTGKSTLFDVFGFLKDCLMFNVRRALQVRGGFQEVLSRNADENKIEIEIQFRLEIAGTERLVTYLLCITKNSSNKVVVEREILRYKRGRYGSPYHFLDFSKGVGSAINNEEDFSKEDTELNREEQELDAPDILAIKGLGQFERFKAANAFRKLIENWHISDFHISAARGSKDAAGYEEHLSDSGDNLQLVARNIFENYPDIFQKIIDVIKHRVPGVIDVKTVSTEDGRLLLQFQDGSFKDPFIDRYVSDGTIKMFAYLILLYDPSPHPVLCVEEPENQLYVSLMPELAEEFRSYAIRGGQVFVSTHSPDFLNATQLDEVFWLRKQDGYTKVIRAKEDSQLVALMAAGDQMGYLWKQGFLGGIDPQ